MSLSLTLDVAISLVFMFVLAALLASTVNEMISGALKLRGVYLTKAIESLTSLGSGNSFKWGGLYGWLFAHFRQDAPTISAVADKAAIAALAAAKDAAAVTGSTAVSVAAAVKGVPDFNTLAGLGSTIDTALRAAGTTPQSIVDLVQRIAGLAALQKHPLLIGTPSGLPSYVPARDFAAAMLGVMADGSSATAFTQAKDTIEKMPDGDLKTALLAFIAAGADTIDKLRDRIENWFDDAMQRVSGIYTRFTRYVMVTLGLIIAVSMNIDSVHLTKALWDQPVLSKAISDSAAQYVTDHKNNPFDCADNPPPTGGAACKNPVGMTAILDIMEKQKLPIGRADADFFGCPVSVTTGGCTEFGWKIWTVTGWLMTALAISLGAQFWFGILGQLTNLRAAGNKPARADKTS